MSYKNLFSRLNAIDRKNTQAADEYNKMEAVLLDQYNNYSIPPELLKFLQEMEHYIFENSLGVKPLEKAPILGSSDRINVRLLPLRDILKSVNSLQGNLPNNLLPIGEGEGGDFIVINLSKDKYGKIYYWDHDTDNLYLISNNMEDFLNKLHILQEDNMIPSDDVEITKITDDFLNMLKNRKQ